MSNKGVNYVEVLYHLQVWECPHPSLGMGGCQKSGYCTVFVKSTQLPIPLIADR